MNRRTARRIAHGLVASSTRIAVESGELHEFLDFDAMPEEDVRLVLDEVGAIADRHAVLSHGEGEVDV